MQVDKESQFKVDNWGSFFLHRLFQLYEKGEKCDGTLLFKNGKSIKVHKLVLSTCTDYFDVSVWKNDTFTLPPLLTHSAVLPIINFMYTGFLNCSAQLNHAVFTAAKYFNVTVLIKLMHAQMGGDVKPPKPCTDLGNTSTPTKIDESASATPSIAATPPSPAPCPSPVETPASVIKLKKLPNNAKPLFVTPQPSTSASVSIAAIASTSQSVPGKKLPFWKKRTTTAGGAGAGTGSPVASGGSRLKQGGTPPPVVASPCRFEADRLATSGDKTGFQPHTECSSFSGIRYIDEPVYKISSSPKPIHQLTTEFNNLNKKRSHDRIQCDEIEDIDEDDVDGDLTCAETVVMVAKGGGASAEDKFDRLTKMATTPKPILKPLTSDSVTAGVVGSNSKKVRFSLVAEGKENTESANSVTLAASPALGGPAPSPSKPVVGGAKEPVAMATAFQRVLISGDKAANLNASQIISEVMKKNPNLMKNNKNFRVLVSGAGKKLENGGGGGGETKLKLIVMKPQTQTQKSQSTAAAVKGSSSNAENTTGPWLCNECGVAGQPMCFETYYLYRRHLHDVHQQRIDARICEYCGYKSSKRNLHLYHLYTKHDVPPPRNIRFPKCDKCNYIALSDSLLIKHNNNHATSSEKLSCKPCKLAFRSQAALQAHNQTCAHCKEAPPGAAASPTKEYSCQYCGKTFNRSINLKAHMRIAHNNESRSLYEEEEEEGVVCAAAGANDDECSTPTANLLQVIRLPMVEGVGIDDGGEGGQRTLLLPAGVFLAGGGGEGGEGTPSSEQEAMSTVASGIATSINLNDASHLMAGDQTVILLDGSSELVLSNTVMLTTPPDDSTSTSSNACAGEYIVPEVMSTTNQLFQTVTMSSSAEGGLPEGASIIVVPPDNQMIVDQDSASEQTAAEQQSSSESVTPSHQKFTTTEDDKCTNIVEEACKRSTIIIETSSVVTGAQKSDSVIVSAQTPRIDLSDWDDMDTSNGGCDNPDQRPVRVTLERMPDII